MSEKNKKEVGKHWTYTWHFASVDGWLRSETFQFFKDSKCKQRSLYVIMQNFIKVAQNVAGRDREIL